ncbi:ABA-responsive protein ABR18-like [Vicia villosa]|uniref:ABA-responsive protein ABR18-like n=1 Tax=Vicia villosa TaxID=3911 RepID=UPI00273CACD4|nr:ABA-responsive protein ABR18-like [Vicia villosa]
MIPSKLFKAVVHDADVIVPNVVDSIKTVEIVEGNGGPGTVKKITFVEGGQTLYVLHKVEAIDDAKFEYNYTIVGGFGISDIVEKISFEAKLVEVEEGKAKGDALFKAIEGYVLANPNYN